MLPVPIANPGLYSIVNPSGRAKPVSKVVKSARLLDPKSSFVQIFCHPQRRDPTTASRPSWKDNSLKANSGITFTLTEPIPETLPSAKPSITETFP